MTTEIEAASVACTTFVQNNAQALRTKAILRAVQTTPKGVTAVGPAELAYAHALFRACSATEAKKVHLCANYAEMLRMGAQLCATGPGNSVARAQLINSVISGPEACWVMATYSPVLKYGALKSALTGAWADFAKLVDNTQGLGALPWVLVGLEEMIVCPAPHHIQFVEGKKFSAQWEPVSGGKDEAAP